MRKALATAQFDQYSPRSPALARSLLIESCENKNSEPGKKVASSNCGQPFQLQREPVVVGCWVSAAGAARCPPLHENRQTKPDKVVVEMLKLWWRIMFWLRKTQQRRMGFVLLLIKNVPLYIKRLRKPREGFYLLALPLLNAARPDPVWPVPLTSRTAGPGQNKQLNPALNEEN